MKLSDLMEKLNHRKLPYTHGVYVARNLVQVLSIELGTQNYNYSIHAFEASVIEVSGKKASFTCLFDQPGVEKIIRDMSTKEYQYASFLVDTDREVVELPIYLPDSGDLKTTCFVFLTDFYAYYAESIVFRHAIDDVINGTNTSNNVSFINDLDEDIKWVDYL